VDRKLHFTFARLGNASGDLDVDERMPSNQDPKRFS
jgi:hypothetical protein